MAEVIPTTTESAQEALSRFTLPQIEKSANDNETTLTPAEAARAAAVKVMQTAAESIPKVELETTRKLNEVEVAVDGKMQKANDENGKILEALLAQRINDGADKDTNAAARDAVEGVTVTRPTIAESVPEATILEEHEIIMNNAATPETTPVVSVMPAGPEGLMDNGAISMAMMGAQDNRFGSPNEGKQSLSRRTNTEKWAKVIDGTAYAVPSAPEVEIPVFLETPVSAPQATAEALEVEAEVAPVAVASVPEAVPESMLPEQEAVAPITPIPNIQPSSSVDMKVTSKIEDGEVRGWRLTAEKKPEVTQAAVTPEASPIEPPSVEAAPNPSPTEVEAAYVAGNIPTVPEVILQPEAVPAVEAVPLEAPMTVPEATPVPAAIETLAVAPVPFEAETQPTATSEAMAEKPEPQQVEKAVIAGEAPVRSKTAREYIGRFGQAIEMNEKFRTLGSAAKSFAHSLYRNAPADAMRAFVWRRSIDFNDRIANYFGEKMLASEANKERVQSLSDRLVKRNAVDAAELDALGKRFGGGVLTPDIAATAAAEGVIGARREAGIKAIVERSAAEEEWHKKREAIFIERRNAAAEKLAAYIEKRLAPYESKIEMIRATKEKLGSEIGDFKMKRDMRQNERDHLFAEVAAINMAAKPASVRMLYEKAMRDYDEELERADDLLEVKTARRAQAEVELKEINAQADTIRPKLESVKEVPKRSRASDKKVAIELPAEPIDAEPSLAESLAQEFDEVRREALPDMTPVDFVATWNKFAGADIPMDAENLSAFMDIEKDAIVPVSVLDEKMTGLLQAMLADKGKKRRLRPGVDQKSIFAHLKAFIQTYLPLERKRT